LGSLQTAAICSFELPWSGLGFNNTIADPGGENAMQNVNSKDEFEFDFSPPSDSLFEEMETNLQKMAALRGCENLDQIFESAANPPGSTAAATATVPFSDGKGVTEVNASAPGSEGESQVDQQSSSATKYPPALEDVVHRARRGDKSVLPELKKALDEHPDFVEAFGNVVEHARQLQLDLIGGPDLLLKESIRRKQHQLRAELLGECPNPLDRLLVDRICLDTLAVNQAEVELDQKKLAPGVSGASLKSSTQRLDSAHRRLMQSIKTLALARKLLRPTPSTLDLLRRSPAPKSERTLSIKRDVVPVAEAEGVLN